mgnify:CR=1 FL=1
MSKVCLSVCLSVCSPTPPASVNRSSPSNFFWMQDDRESDLEAFDIARAARTAQALGVRGPRKRWCRHSPGRGELNRLFCAGNGRAQRAQKNTDRSVLLKGPAAYRRILPEMWCLVMDAVDSPSVANTVNHKPKQTVFMFRTAKWW